MPLELTVDHRVIGLAMLLEILDDTRGNHVKLVEGLDWHLQRLVYDM